MTEHRRNQNGALLGCRPHPPDLEDRTGNTRLAAWKATACHHRTNGKSNPPRLPLQQQTTHGDKCQTSTTTFLLFPSLKPKESGGSLPAAPRLLAELQLRTEESYIWRQGQKMTGSRCGSSLMCRVQLTQGYVLVGIAACRISRSRLWQLQGESLGARCFLASPRQSLSF